MKKYAMAMLAATMLCGSAHAAVISQTYDFTATFSDGAYPLINGSFVSSYDDTSTVPYPISITSFSSAQLGNFGFLTPFNSGNTTYFGPTTNSGGFIIQGRTNSFLVRARVLTDGTLTGTQLVYATVNSPSLFSTTSITLTKQIVATIPEPTTWAMMMVGFAMVGATARYRRRSARCLVLASGGSGRR